MNRIGGDIIAPGGDKTFGPHTTKPARGGSKAKLPKIIDGGPMRAVLLIITVLIISRAAYAQVPASPTTPSGIEEAYLAKDDGEGKAGEQVTEFQTTDVPIYCVVLLESNQAA